MTHESPISEDSAGKLERVVGGTLRLRMSCEARYREALASLATGPIALRETPYELKLS